MVEVEQFSRFEEDPTFVEELCSFIEDVIFFDDPKSSDFDAVW